MHKIIEKESGHFFINVNWKLALATTEPYNARGSTCTWPFFYLLSYKNIRERGDGGIFILAELLKLTKNILKTLEVRDTHMSVYDMFSFNTGLALKIAASTFVYITVQLQLAFPNLKEVHKIVNVTLPPAEFDFDPRKVKEFWFL